MTPTLATKIETDQSAAFAPLLEQIFAPAGADDKRVKVANKCLNNFGNRPKYSAASNGGKASCGLNDTTKAVLCKHEDGRISQQAGAAMPCSKEQIQSSVKTQEYDDAPVSF